MPKQNREYKKGAPHRDARLFIIIAEGEREDAYFRSFISSDISRLKVLIIDREENASAPKHFIDRLNKAERESNYSPEVDDQVWFVCDVDRWRKQIEELRFLCEGKSNLNLAVSNPCFEVWLHFHSGSISFPNDTNCTQLKSSLPKTLAGEFNPKHYGLRIRLAAKHAREADTSPESQFPDVMQTKLYKLAESMLEVLGNRWG